MERRTLTTLLVCLAIIMLLAMAACGKKKTGDESVGEEVTAIAATIMAPTDTPTPAPPTNTPTATLLNIGGLLSGTPVAVWKDFPIMSGAIAGEEKDAKYLFTIRATSKDIVKFYSEQLPKFGWSARRSNGTPEPSGIITLVFMKSSNVLLVSIIPQKDGMLVMLGRQKL